MRERWGGRRRWSRGWNVALLGLLGLGIAALGVAGRGVRGQAPSPSPTPSPTPVVTLVPGTHVTYPPGWNLVGGPTGTVLIGPRTLYALPSSATGYQTLDGMTPLVAGQGYWAYFDYITPQLLPPNYQQVVTIQLPAGRYALIGNPLDSLAVVTGADVIYTYDQVAGYEPVTVLQPGQGAWAFSAAGGTLTFANLAP